MRLRLCRACGVTFPSDKEQESLCPTCLAAQKSTTIRNRTCRQCGKTFPGGPRAWYCPDCRAERSREQNRAHKRNGTKRKLGSIDRCEQCGAEYVVQSGLQRYCPACAEAAVRAKDNAASRAYNASHKEQRQELRAMALKPCVICGGIVPRGSQAVTCSQACAEEHKRRQQQRARAASCKPSTRRQRTGMPGVYWVATNRDCPWMVLHKGAYIGSYTTKEEAYQAKSELLQASPRAASGMQWVHRHPQTGRWQVTIRGEYIGIYDTIEEAVAARNKVLKDKARAKDAGQPPGKD